LSTDIKELQELIDRERVAEEKVRKAKQEAQAIVKEARDKAEIIVGAVDSDPRWEELKRAKNNEIERKKAEIEEEFKRKVSGLEASAKKNFSRAVERVFEQTLRGKL
jgi:V/A-type H+-transporting ATPase subunit G/H